MARTMTQAYGPGHMSYVQILVVSTSQDISLDKPRYGFPSSGEAMRHDPLAGPAGRVV